MKASENKSDENVKQLNSDQISTLKAAGRRLDGMLNAYTRAARHAGELKDQLNVAEGEEVKARQNLKESESEYTRTMQEVAEELGYTQGQSWQFDQSNFIFTVMPEPGPQLVKTPPDSNGDTGEPEETDNTEDSPDAEESLDKTLQSD
jgi:hypothetical protein